MKATTIAHAQPLRATTFLSTLIGLPLAIASTIVAQHLEHQKMHYARWGRWRHRSRATALCFPYLGLSVTLALCGASFYRLRKTGKALPARAAWLDLLAGVLYLAVLLPIWIREVAREITAPGLLLLVSYTTVPMLINMTLHFTTFLTHLPLLLPRGLPSLFPSSPRLTTCPNCHLALPPPASSSSPTTQIHHHATDPAIKDEGYSLLRGEDYLDEDAVAYRDARESADLLRAEEEGVKGEGEGEGEGEGDEEVGKGKGRIIDV